MRPHTFHTPTGILMVAFSRFQTLMVAIERISVAKFAFIEMLRGLVPDRVRHRVLAVGEACDRLGQGQRGALGVGEIGRLAPGRHGKQALVGFAQLAGGLGMHVDADAATIDLAGAQVHQFQKLFRQALLGQTAKGLKKIHGLGQDHDRVFHAGVHRFGLHLTNLEVSGHIGRTGFVMGMTDRDEGM